MNAVTGNLPPLDNRVVAELPGDPSTLNHPRQVSRSCYSLVAPRKFPQARLLAWSRELGAELDVSPEHIGSDHFTAFMSGSTPLPGLQSYALCYGGHQFGHWAGQLGDGRAINLGEILLHEGQHQILQLKGAGPTPYSRTADGLAVMRSSVREFLCSEAMHHLGVPTTRALSLVATGENVLRDMFYDGNPALEPGAIVCRVAPSFMRFGSYEIFTARGELDVLRRLVDFTIRRDFPHLLEGAAAHATRNTKLAPSDRAHREFNADNTLTPDIYSTWFHEVCQRTATLLMHWMRVGFVHGVMNTDNMSILGLTIDYGPYGWLENYDPHWTPNTTDAEGRRYRFGQQPQIALWNLVQLANALYPLIESVVPLEQALESYRDAYETQWLQMQRNKLGLLQSDAQDKQLVENLLDSFRHIETDMTLFYRALAQVDFTTSQQSTGIPEVLQQAWYNIPAQAAQQPLLDWLQFYHQRLQQETLSPAQRAAHMNQHNPLYVLRNWLAQLAIDEIEQEGSTKKLEELQQVLQQPYTEQAGKHHLASKRPEWARQRAGCSMLSCSS